MPGEILTGNDLKVWGNVHLIPLGDIDMDGIVDIIDASRVALAFGSTPGTQYWIPAADMNNDGIVDIIDASIMAINFNKSVIC